MNWELKMLFEELVDGQRKILLECGRSRVPTLTSEDVLQPNDYPQLETDPLFRYEEGILAGLQTAQAALLAFLKSQEN